MQQGSKRKLDLYKQLRTAIITGQHLPGERLEVDDIRHYSGCSITLVREVLQMLSHEGLVTIKPRSGYFVRPMSLKELRDLLELREILETAAIAITVNLISDDEIGRLESIHGAYTGDDNESYSRYTDENRNFHTQLARASGNDALADTLGQLLDRLARFMVIRRAGPELPDIHGKLLKKLRERDGEGAKETLRQELDETRQSIFDRIMREEGEHLLLGSRSE